MKQGTPQAGFSNSVVRPGLNEHSRCVGAKECSN
jgi:hypothetical protein